MFGAHFERLLERKLGGGPTVTFDACLVEISDLLVHCRHYLGRGIGAETDAEEGHRQHPVCKEDYNIPVCTHCCFCFGKHFNFGWQNTKEFVVNTPKNNSSGESPSQTSRGSCFYKRATRQGGAVGYVMSIFYFEIQVI